MSDATSSNKVCSNTPIYTVSYTKMPEYSVRRVRRNWGCRNSWPKCALTVNVTTNNYSFNVKCCYTTSPFCTLNAGYSHHTPKKSRKFYCSRLWSLQLTLTNQEHNSTVTDCGVYSWPWQTKTAILLLLTVEFTADLGKPRPQFYCYWLWSLQLTLANQDHNSTVIDCEVYSWPWQTMTAILLLLTVEFTVDLDKPKPQFYFYWLNFTADLGKPRPQFYSQSFLTHPCCQGDRFT